jgi:hypothetical protein
LERIVHYSALLWQLQHHQQNIRHSPPSVERSSGTLYQQDHGTIH